MMRLFPANGGELVTDCGTTLIYQDITGERKMPAMLFMLDSFKGTLQTYQFVYSHALCQ